MYILSSIAEFENNRRKERQIQGIRAAQEEGKYTGRKSVINKTLIQKVQDLKENKNLSGKRRTFVSAIMKKL
jgi:DNA invertase Pin-like site-specific DNA recombinase